LFLTLTNPTTILSFAAVFSSLGLVGTRAGYLAASVLVLGVFLGSALWWLGLSGGVGACRDRIGPGALRWVNPVSGALITAFGVGVMISGAFQLS
jgi:threonine/homoserine/homoserine lactone efflux protein